MSRRRVRRFSRFQFVCTGLLSGAGLVAGAPITWGYDHPDSAHPVRVILKEIVRLSGCDFAEPYWNQLQYEQEGSALILAGYVLDPDPTPEGRSPFRIRDAKASRIAEVLAKVARFAVNVVLDGVMVGWGVLMLLLARGPIRSGQSDSAKFLLIGIIAWFIVDSSASFAANIPGNVVLNVVFLAMFAPPLVRLLQTR